jgi:hypothetical protein
MIYNVAKVSLLLCASIGCASCAPGQLWDRHFNDLPKYSSANFEYIGCHVVTGERYAMAPLGFKVKATGSRIFFKQRNANGSSATLAAKPC